MQEQPLTISSKIMFRILNWLDHFRKERHHLQATQKLLYAASNYIKIITLFHSIMK